MDETLTPIFIWAKHPYVDMSERARAYLGVDAGTSQCRQPIIGGGTCLLPAENPDYHTPKR